ncbi:MAG TPA: hypothetical protein PKH77_26510, partial [Anaerolineae bacterium]|nr:hypothetical protein [Anaerolineae bacterium]
NPKAYHRSRLFAYLKGIGTKPVAGNVEVRKFTPYSNSTTNVNQRICLCFVISLSLWGPNCFGESLQNRLRMSNGHISA